MKPNLPLGKITTALFILGLAPCLSAQIFIDFQSPPTAPSTASAIPNDFTENFRIINAGTTFIQQFDAVSNGYIKGGAGVGTYVYDANGSDPGVSSFSVSQANPLTLTFNPSGQATNSSIGIYIIDAGNPTSAYLGILNILSGNDTLRFSNGTVNPSTNASGTLVAGSHPNDTNFISPEPQGDATAGGIPFASTATFIYGINVSNEPVFSFNVNGTTSTFTLSGFTAFTDVEIGIRSNGNGQAMRIDNLGITAVPEPSAFALVGLVCLGAGLLRRRRLEAGRIPAGSLP